MRGAAKALVKSEDLVEIIHKKPVVVFLWGGGAVRASIDGKKEPRR